MNIRHADLSDLNAISDLERACFPPSEAASPESFEKRIRAFPGHFWLLYENNRLISCVNGMVTDEAVLTDEMFENASMHDENGAWQMLFGVLTHPEYRLKGYASMLLSRAIEDSKAEGRKGVVLTCKRPLVPFYQRFGFQDEGISSSGHGGALWHQMRLVF